MRDVISQNVMLSSGKFDKEKNYWLGKLEGEIPVVGFVVDAPWQNFYKSESFRFPGELYHRLLRISNGSEYGMFILMITGIDSLLAKYSGNHDIVVGVPILKQEAPGPYFNDIIPLRNMVNGEMNYKELLFQVNQTVLEAYDNMNYPFNEAEKLFDTMAMFKNIHDGSAWEEKKCRAFFSFQMTGDTLDYEIEYDNGGVDNIGKRRRT